MKLEHYSKEKLEKDLKRIISKHLDLDQYELFYFGSRVTGKGDEKSDIDIGIKGSKEISADAMSKIKEELEWLPTLYTIELVDFASTSGEFNRVALQKIEKIK